MFFYTICFFAINALLNEQNVSVHALILDLRLLSKQYFPNVFFNEVQLFDELGLAFVLLLSEIGELEQAHAYETAEFAKLRLKIGSVRATFMRISDHFRNEKGKRAQVDLEQKRNQT